MTAARGSRPDYVTLDRYLALVDKHERTEARLAEAERLLRVVVNGEDDPHTADSIDGFLAAAAAPEEET